MRRSDLLVYLIAVLLGVFLGTTLATCVNDAAHAQQPTVTQTVQALDVWTGRTGVPRGYRYLFPTTTPFPIRVAFSNGRVCLLPDSSMVRVRDSIACDWRSPR